MRYPTLLLSSLIALAATAQWTRDEGLPDTEMPSLLVHGEGLFAGGVGTAYHRPQSNAPWATWQTIPGEPYYVDALAHHDGQLYAGTGGNYVHRATDSTTPWQATPGISGMGSHQINSFAEFDGALYCGTVGAGTFRHNGTQWVPFGNLVQSLAGNVFFLRTIGDTLWCGAGGNGYLFYTTSGADDWTPVPVDVVTGLSIEFTDLIAVPGALVAGGTMGTYRSTDQGASWTWTAGPAAIVKFTWWNNTLIASRTGADTRWFRSDTDGLAWTEFSHTALSFGLAVYDGKLWSGQLDGLWYLESLPTAVPEHAALEFELSPNPATDHLTIRSADPGTAQYIIRDRQGRTTQTGQITGPDGSIPLEFLAPGAYQVQVIREGRSAVRRFVVQ